MTPTPDPVKVLQVLHEAPKYPGVDTVVRLVQIDGEVMVDIRDRIPGALADDQPVWGRGYLFPAGLASEIIDALLTIKVSEPGAA